MLFILTIPVIYAQSACMSLTGSKMCPSFQAASIWKGPNAQTFTSVAQFDAYIQSHLLSPSPATFNAAVGCSVSEGVDVPLLQSTLCATMVDIGKKKGGCKAVPTVQGLCKTSAAKTIAGLDTLFATCPSGKTKASIYSDIRYYATNDAPTSAGCLVSQPADGTVGILAANVTANATDVSADGSFQSDNSTDTSGDGLNPTSTLAANTTAPSGKPSPSAVAPAPVSEAPHSSGSTMSITTIGAIIGGVVVVLVIGFAVYYRSKKSHKPVAAKGPGKGYDFGGDIEYGNVSGKVTPQSQLPQVSETKVVVFEYIKNVNHNLTQLFDEITLSVGDKVLVKTKFDDGWAYGVNMATKEEGNFPMACVDELGSAGRDARSSYAYSKRASSIGGYYR
jgi:hypothetical protein